MEVKFENVKEIAEKWKDEKGEKRAIVVIAIEVLGEDEKEAEASTEAFLHGKGGLTMEAIKAICKDKTPDNALRDIINRANLEVGIEKVISIIGGN